MNFDSSVLRHYAPGKLHVITQPTGVRSSYSVQILEARSAIPKEIFLEVGVEFENFRVLI